MLSTAFTSQYRRQLDAFGTLFNRVVIWEKSDISALHVRKIRVTDGVQEVEENFTLPVAFSNSTLEFYRDMAVAQACFEWACKFGNYLDGYITFSEIWDDALNEELPDFGIESIYIIARNEVEFNTYTYGRDELFVFLDWERWERLKEDHKYNTGDLWNPYGTEREHTFNLTGINIRIIEGGLDSPVYHDIIKLESLKKITIAYEVEPII